MAVRIPWRPSSLVSAALMRGIPIVTALLFAGLSSPSEYAIVPLLVALTPIVALVSTLGIEQSFFRAWASQRIPKYLRSEARLALLVALIMSLLLLPVSLAVSWLVKQDPLVFLLAATAGVVQGFTLNLIVSWTRSVQNSAGMLSIALLASLSALGARLVSISQGATLGLSWIAGDLTIAVLGLLLYGIWYSKGVEGKTDWREVLKFGAPMSKHGLWQWLLGSADRFIFGALLPSTQVGLFGASAQVANGFNAIATEVNKSGLHHYASQSVDQVRVKRDGRILLILWLAVLPFAAVGLVVLEMLGYPGVVWVGIALYVSLIPLLVYLPLANIVSITLGRSGALSVTSMVGAAINVGTNLLLVGALGIYAAALANFLGFSTMTILLRLKSSPPERKRHE